MDLQRPKTPLASRSGTALEKLARGLKQIGRGRTDATEMVEVISPPKRVPSQLEMKSKSELRSKSIRKVRSLATIEGRNRNKTTSPPTYDSSGHAFDVDEMRRHRQKFEDGIVSAQRNGSSYSRDI